MCFLAQDKLFRGTRMSIYNQSFYMTMVSAVLSFSGAVVALGPSCPSLMLSQSIKPAASLLHTPDAASTCYRAADERPAGAGGALRVAAPQGAGLDLRTVHGGDDR